MSDAEALADDRACGRCYGTGRILVVDETGDDATAIRQVHNQWPYQSAPCDRCGGSGLKLAPERKTA